MVAQIKKFQKRKKSKSLFFSICLGSFFLLLISAFVVSNWKIQKKRSQLTAQIENLEKEIQTLQERNEQLRAGISQGLTEESLEKEARERFNLQKPGEEVVKVLPPLEEEKEKEGEKGFWQKIWDKIKLW